MSANKIKLLLLLLLIALVAFSFVLPQDPSGGILKGNTNPPGIGLRAFLFSGKDTLSVNIVNDAFQFSNVRSGTYKLLIEVSPPYRNAVKEGLRVIDDGLTDAGQIELQK